MEIKNSTLDDIAVVVGFSATVRLAVWFGDVNNVYVPPDVKDDHILVRLIGKSAANRLSKTWGGKHLAIPRLTSYERDMTHRMIGHLIVKGCSTREVSHLARVSERRVQQVCRELESAGLIPVIAARKTPRENYQEKVSSVFQQSAS